MSLSARKRRMVDFNVEEIQPLELRAFEPLHELDLMSPYVWEEPGGELAILVRAVPKHPAKAGNTGSIYYGTGTNGLHFNMHKYPVIVPGTGPLDIGGCEDPTVVKWRGRYIVYYTGVDRTLSSGQMLYASGRSITELKRRGIAHASDKTEGNVKEATVERTADGHWRLFYEYARDNASRVGLAIGKGPLGPWSENPAPFLPRPDRWDNWHLSTGPLLTSDPDMPVMFYNGATQDARWRIGWVAFDRDCRKVVDRCIVPMIIPPPPLERMGIDIAFAASVLARGHQAHLYYSLADQALFRAIIRKS